MPADRAGRLPARQAPPARFHYHSMERIGMEYNPIRATRKGNSDQPPWLRPLCASVLLAAIEEINLALAPDAKPNHRQQALRACHWILSDDDDPLAYLNVCDLLNLPAERLRPRVLGIDEFLRANGVPSGDTPLAVPEALRPPLRFGISTSFHILDFSPAMLAADDVSINSAMT